jgi:hypothetical protein
MLSTKSQSIVVLASSSHLIFFSSTRSSLPCLRVAVSYKPGRICSSYHFPFHNANFADLSTLHFRPSFIVFASRSFFPSISSLFLCLRMAVSYKPGRICAQLPLSVPQLHLRRSIYSSITPFFYRRRISLFFSSTFSSVTASFRRPFHRYINDLSFLCAFGSTQEPLVPFMPYTGKQTQYLRQQPQTTQMPLPIYLHAHPPLPHMSEY